MRVTMVNKYYSAAPRRRRDRRPRTSPRGSSSTRARRCARSSATRAATRVEETIDGVDVVRLPRQFALSSSARRAGDGRRADAPRCAATTPPDVIHLHFPYPWGELCVAAGAARRADACCATTATSCARSACSPRTSPSSSACSTASTSSSPRVAQHESSNSEFLAPRADKCRVVDYGLHVERHRRAAGRRAAARRRAPRRARAGARSCCSSAGSSTTRAPTCSCARWRASTPTSS